MYSILQRTVLLSNLLDVSSSRGLAFFMGTGTFKHRVLSANYLKHYVHFAQHLSLDFFRKTEAIWRD